MNTLIDFVRYTKSWEYVIAICAIFSFIVFWRLATGGSQSKANKDVVAKLATRPAPGGLRGRRPAPDEAGEDEQAHRPAA